jgi:hypothetical protein
MTAGPGFAARERAVEAGRDLFELMGHEDDRRHAVGRHRGKSDEEILARSEIEPRGRLVEQDEVGLSHQRPGGQ